MRSGAGGPGAVSYRREKYVPRGGPDGGSGGRGGSVYIQATTELATLLDFRYQRNYHAAKGRPGGKQGSTGADGESRLIRLPVGTQVYNAETDELVVDLVEPGQRFLVAKGGKGGKGNASFATPSRRTPDYAQGGLPGEEMELRLELKLLADVGLVGFPNAGKSTLVSRISRARPKIADYPFTTLQPNLGVVRVDVDRSYVVADIPGLVEGAADGVGLGHQFLRHIERTSLFLYLVTQDADPARNPVGDYHALRRELGKYDTNLLDRPSLIILSQCDRPDVLEQFEDVQAELSDQGQVLSISAVTGAGLDALHKAVADALSAAGRWGGKESE